METQTEENSHFEDYLKETGWGLFYKFIIAVSCVCHFMRGITFVTITFSVALSSCNPIYMSEINAMRIFISYLVGCGVGGLAGNSLCDRYGRKRYLAYSTICIFFASFTAAFAYNVFVIIGAVMFLGVGLEVNAMQTRLLIIEILGKKTRGFWMVFCDLFWSFGYVITIFFLIFFETPTFLNSGYHVLNLTIWRVMFAFCGGASLLIACVIALIEESPRFYLSVGRNFLAFLLFKQLYAINKSSFAENIKIKEDEIKYLIKPYDLDYREPEFICKRIKKFLWRFGKSVQFIFSHRFSRTTWVLILMKIPIIILGIYQLNIALAKHVTYNEAPHKYEGLDFIYPIFELATPKKNATSFCDIDEKNTLFFKYYLMLGLASIPGQILCMFIVDKLDRKYVLFSGLLLASCSFLIMQFFKNIIFQIILTSLITASISVVILIITLLNLELYPTAIRGTSNAVTSFPGYILAIIFLSFILIEHKIFAIIMGILYCCLSVFTCFLPELKGKPMIE